MYPCDGPSRLCDVRETDHFRSGAAPRCGRREALRGGFCRTGRGRTVPELWGMHVPELWVWEVNKICLLTFTLILRYNFSVKVGELF